MPVGRKDKVAYRLVIFSFNKTIVGASVLLTEDETNDDGLLEASGVLADAAGLGFYPVSSIGTYGTITVDSAGNWSYLAENDVPVIQNLRKGEFVSDVFAIFSKDDETIVKVQITIKGVNEVAVTITSDAGIVTEDELIDGVLIATGSVTTSDGGDMRAESLTGDYGTLIMQANGAWQYIADNDQVAIQALSPSDSLIEQFTVTHSNGSAQSTITITLNGADDAPILTGDSASVSEDDNPLFASGLVSAIGGDAGEQSFIAATQSGLYGTFSVDTLGNWTYQADNSLSTIQALDEDEFLTETFLVMSVDGVNSASVVITIHGRDDSPTLSEGFGVVTEDIANSSNNLVVRGTLVATGGDAGEQGFLSDAISGSYGTLIVASNGDWTYLASNAQIAIQQLTENDTLNEVFVVYSNDGVTTTTVTITIQGSDDVPVLTGSAGSVTEDSGSTLTASGVVTTSGGDAGEQGFIAETLTGQYGQLIVDALGNWIYSANNAQSVIQALNSGDTLLDTFTVYSSDGITTTSVVITINGLDDEVEDLIPILTSDVGTVTEDDAATLITSGQVTSTGGDVGEEGFIAEELVGDYGTLVIESSGNWTYQADNSQVAIQQLTENDTLTEVFIVTSADTVTTTTVTITIVGTDDVPILTGDSDSVTKDDSDWLTISGVVTASGGDAGEQGFIAEVITGNYGSLTIDEQGNWTYEADNNQSAIQDLYDGDLLTETFAVLSSDGVTTTDVEITIYGSGELIEIPEEPDDFTASAWLTTGTWG